VAATLIAATPVGADRVAARSEGNGLDETSVNTFLFDAERDIVRVTIDITLTNVTTDRVDGDRILQTYWDAYYVAVPLGAENIVATRDGRVLDGVLESNPEFPAYSFYEFPLGRRVYSGQTASINVTYDHVGAPPRAEVPWRINAAYAGFVAFGLGDDDQVTIEIVKPVGYEFDEFTNLDEYVASEPDGFGSVSYTRTGGDEFFETVVGMHNDEGLVSTPIEVDDIQIELRTWPGDQAFVDFARDTVATGIPELEEMIGIEWPIDETVDVRQTVEPSLYGYGGWFDQETNEISVGEELDSDLLYHELSHAWFNEDLAVDRWVTEGFAQVIAAEMVRRDGDEPLMPELPPPSVAQGRRLQDWSPFPSADETERDIEEWGYTTSFWVVDALVDEIGFEATRDVIGGLDRHSSAYDSTVEAAGMFGTWNAVYDQFVETGGSTIAPEVFTEFVLGDADAALLNERAQVRPEYDVLAERAAPWGFPDGVRHAMESWRFDQAAAGIAAANEVLDLRDRLDEIIDDIGIDQPDSSSKLFEDSRRTGDSVDFSETTEALESDIEAGERVLTLRDGVAEAAVATGTDPIAVDGSNSSTFTEAEALLHEQLDVLDQVGDTVEADEATGGFLATIGLLGTDVPRTIDDARDAIALGDLDGARGLLDDANDTLDGADEDGTFRVGMAAGAVLLLLTLAVGVIVRLRRRRRSRSGLVRGAERLGGDRVDLDENALTRAHLGGVDHTLDVTAWHGGQAAGATGVVERSTSLGHVGDSILELDEDVVAVIDADAIAGAEVLIDPDTHDSEGR
jgi:hypothetical protein